MQSVIRCQSFGKIFFIALLVSCNVDTYAMEALVAEEIEGAGIRGLETGAQEALTRSIAEEVGVMDAEGLKALTPAAQDALRSEIQAALKSVAGEIKPGISMEALGTKVGGAVKEGFINKLDGIGISSSDKIAIANDFNLDGGQVLSLEKAPVMPSTITDVAADVRIEATPEQLRSPSAQADIASGDVTGQLDASAQASKQVEQAVKEGAPEAKIKELQGKADKVSDAQTLDKAKENYKVKDTQAKTDAANQVKNDQAVQDDAAKKVQDASSSKDAQDAQQKELDAKNKTDTSTKEKEEVDRSSGKQKIKQAEAERDALKAKRAELSTARDAVKKGSPEWNDLTAQYDKAGEDLTKAETAITTAKDEYLATTKDWALGERARGVGRATKTWAAGKAGEIGSTLFNAVLFMVPSLALNAWQEWQSKKAALATMKSPQKFGNILMVIPPPFVNNDQPSQSKFDYVALMDENTELTNEYLKNGNYFVVLPDYGDPGMYAITDPSAPRKMLHLNTGFVLAGDGQPADPDVPTIPILAQGQKRNLQETLDSLTEGLEGGVETQVTEDLSTATGSSSIGGSSLIATLFATPKKPGSGAFGQYPPLMRTALQTLQGGAYFGDPRSKAGALKLRGITPASAQFLKFITQATGIPINVPDHQEDIPYVAQGLYLYETQDTPFIKMVLSKIGADDPNSARLHSELKDYIVIQSYPTYGIVPLETPVPLSEKPYVPRYVVNPSAPDNFYVYSLLNNKIYDWNGQIYDPEVTPPFQYDQKGNMVAGTVKGMDAPLPEPIAKQIDAVKSYIKNKLKYGPFVYGSLQLSIDSTWADKGVYVYRIPKFLESGDDDYVVAIKVTKGQPSVTSLPADDITYFVSLVTSRFYTNSMAPDLREAAYWVVSPKNNPNVQAVTTKRPSDDQTTIAQGKAPWYTLFVQGTVNPNKPPVGTIGLLTKTYLPVPDNWALDKVPYSASATVGQVLQTNAPDLLKLIKAAHDSWIKSLDTQNPWAISNAMGPFDFTSNLLANVKLVATSEADIKNGNFVYTSDFYPQEYLVMGNDSQGADAGSEFDPAAKQRYALSLSTGNVYDGQDSGKLVSTIKDVGALIDKLNRIHPFLPELSKRITRAQRVSSIQVQNQLYGPDIAFGPFSLYINKTDFYSGQYIYADVSGLGMPLLADGNENKSVIDKVKDYFICRAEAAVTGNDGKPVLDANGNPTTKSVLGAPMGADVTHLISLVTGNIYDRGGALVKSYKQFDFANLDTADPLSFSNSALSLIQAKSNLPIRADLLAKIKSLTQASYNQYLAEKKQIEELKAQEEKDTPEDLNANIRKNLEAASYLPANPALLPHPYLKYLDTKYYRVTPSIAEAKDSPGVTYTDYNVGEKGKDARMGVIYDANGKVLTTLEGRILDDARRAAGIIVESNGNQKLGIGFLHVNLPMKVNGASAMDVTTLPLQHVADIDLTFYYNHAVNNFYVLVATKTSKKYVDLWTGFAYNLDGTPRLNEGKVYKGSSKTVKNDILLVGQDTTGLPRFVYASNIDGQLASYSVTNIEENATFKANSNDKGSIYLALSDDDPSYSLCIGHVTADKNGTLLAQPYYLIWNGSTYDFLGSYKQDLTSHYALISYIKTRPAGSAPTQGEYVETDNANPYSGKPRVGAVIWGVADQKIEALVYNNRFLSIAGGANSATYTDSEGKAVSIRIRQEHDETSGGSWLSITKGSSTYDYVYDTLVFNTDLVSSCGDRSDPNNPNLLNLECLKQDWELNITTLIPNGVLQGSTKNDKISNIGLAHSIQPTVSPGSVEYPPAAPKNASQIVSTIIDRISLEPSGMVYVYHPDKKAPATMKQFVYQLGTTEQQFNWYTPSMNGWYVDLSNGILYMPIEAKGNAYPVGSSLLPSSLAELLDTLQVMVKINSTTGLPEKLMYRVMEPSSTLPLAKTATPAASKAVAQPVAKRRAARRRK